MERGSLELTAPVDTYCPDFATCIGENLTGPLGMNETAFLMNDERAANSVPVHRRGADRKWIVVGEILNQQPDWWAGGHGLYSTPRDYLRFQRMLLGNGTFEGTKILESETVDAAFTNQIGDLNFLAKIPTADPAATHDFNLGPGLKLGLWAVAQPLTCGSTSSSSAPVAEGGPPVDRIQQAARAYRSRKTTFSPLNMESGRPTTGCRLRPCREAPS
ncbi:MAG: serine hydrolase [Pseudonocardiaceae bacterium]